MRAYYFVNGLYMSEKQLGIQSIHSTTEMFVKYDRKPDDFSSNQLEILWEWAVRHRTVILLNAVNVKGIREIRDFFAFPQDYDIDESPYPWADFHEDADSLDGALTCASVILPAKIYEGAAAIRKLKGRRRDDPARMNFEYHKVLTVDCNDDKGPRDIAYTAFEVELMERLGTYKLA